MLLRVSLYGGKCKKEFYFVKQICKKNVRYCQRSTVIVARALHLEQSLIKASHHYYIH